MEEEDENRVRSDSTSSSDSHTPQQVKSLYVDSPGTGQRLPDEPKYEDEIVIDSSRMKPLSEELGLMDGGDTGTVL